jgi:hypothetical protein
MSEGKMKDHGRPLPKRDVEDRKAPPIGGVRAANGGLISKNLSARAKACFGRACHGR